MNEAVRQYIERMRLMNSAFTLDAVRPASARGKIKKADLSRLVKQQIWQRLQGR